MLTPLVQQQIDKRIAQGEDAESARDALLAEKQPSREFVTPQQLGELALFLCSDAAASSAWGGVEYGWRLGSAVSVRRMTRHPAMLYDFNW